MKKFLKISLVVIVLLAIALYFSSGMIKRFVATRVQEIVAGYINPELVIEDFSYVFPFTVKVKNLSLQQDGVKIVEVPAGTIVLEGIPLTSRQVRFEKFVLESPTLRISVNESDEVIGWGDLLKPDDAPDSADVPIRNSEAFAVNAITIENGTIEYTDVDNPDRAMQLDGINLAIDAKRTTDQGQTDSIADRLKNNLKKDATKPEFDVKLPEGAPEIPTGENWYRVETTLDRAPIVKISIDGGLDIDSGNILLRSLMINAQLDPKEVEALPPQVQKFVENNDVNGQLEIQIWGSLIVDDMLEGPLDLTARLTDAKIGGEDGYVEINELNSRVKLRSDLLVMTELESDLLGGTLNGDGQILLADEPARPAGRLTTEKQAEQSTQDDANQTPPPMIPAKPAYSTIVGLQLKKINLQTFTSTKAENTRLRGDLDVDIEAAGIATEFPRTLTGTGRVDITNGRLANIPVVSALGRVMDVILRRDVNNDQLLIDLELRPDGVVMPQISLIAGLMAARGRGIVRFDDTMDLVLNGGPMERLQQSIGALGRALGALTDRIVRYQITGPIGEPRVRVRPFGITVRDPTRLPDPEESTEAEPEQATETGEGDESPGPDAESDGSDG
ncbi:MAG: AsmA family protein [Phycisphaerales bacterium]|nr:AsmA family protein [Phycisphaerales bacterium]